MTEPVLTLVPRAAPAHDFAAEKAVLGGLLLRNHQLDTVIGLLAPEAFADPNNRLLFDAILRKIEAGEEASRYTLRSFAEARLGDSGGADFFDKLSAAATVMPRIDQAAHIVRACWQRRGFETLAVALLALAKDDDGNAETLGAKALQIAGRIDQIAQTSEGGQGLRAWGDFVESAMDQAELALRDGTGGGISSGFASLDAIVGGLRRSDMIVVGARPGTGKTALGLGIALAVAKAEHPVAFFSLEMSGEQLAARAIAEAAGVDSQALASGQLPTGIVVHAREMMRAIKRLPIRLDDSSALQISRITHRARQMKRDSGLGLVVVDYLQLARSSRPRENRYAEITEISGALKAMAKELDVPVIVLAQLNRHIENRDNKRPRLSDLRDSGSIEQDADVVILVNRDQAAGDADPNQRTEIELLVEKNRHGKRGLTRLTFEPRSASFVGRRQ